jgi:gluconolactonase
VGLSSPNRPRWGPRIQYNEWTQVARYDGWPNGLKIHQDGRIFIADHLRGILQLDPQIGKVTTILDRVRREVLKGVNDMAFAKSGDLYFTDQGQTGLQDPTGRVYRLKPDGHVDLLIDTVPSRNGIVLTPDEKALYVAVTRANQIWRLPLHPDGTTSKVAAFITLSGGLAGPDGLAMDAEGNLAIAHCGLGPRGSSRRWASRSIACARRRASPPPTSPTAGPATATCT